MTIELDIEHLNWDEWNREHITKHQVEQDEAEEVSRTAPLVRATYKGRFQLIGPTRSGRILSVAVGPDPRRSGTYYVFSARPASRKERRELQELQGGSSS